MTLFGTRCRTQKIKPQPLASRLLFASQRMPDPKISLADRASVSAWEAFDVGGIGNIYLKWDDIGILAYFCWMIMGGIRNQRSNICQGIPDRPWLPWLRPRQASGPQSGWRRLPPRVTAGRWWGGPEFWWRLSVGKWWENDQNVGKWWKYVRNPSKWVNDLL